MRYDKMSAGIFEASDRLDQTHLCSKLLLHGLLCYSSLKSVMRSNSPCAEENKVGCKNLGETGPGEKAFIEVQFQSIPL